MSSAACTGRRGHSVITPVDPEEIVEHDSAGPHVEQRDSLVDTFADLLGVDRFRVLCTTEDARAAEREQ
ncbi:hypothetical protein [Umezawaea sp. Da 62-37]|uniref:hypothetical protein n=1 Tax=Umezawaea sp. Da 62-37 TaxID=3075927 RepID=UPI0028F730F2|nr:hypothetical protein [Umezawaea sp. Da 62-37]WNV84840.1 hypothetical protein RM788_42870 [Umezawaea sp. Da 62-37]